MVVRLTRSAQLAGFTLIELLVVVAITSILAISATLVFSRSTDAATMAADAFKADAESLRRLAMLSGADHLLHLGQTGWETRTMDGTADGRALRAHDLSGVAVEIKSGSADIVFYRDGRVTDSVVQFGAVSCLSVAGALPRCDQP